ncbi:MAG: isochorismatase family protein [Candidatus Moduliflexus flocculans]|nr:isochorismatase family protein [Candidatus Moduliflexus flocculans]
MKAYLDEKGVDRLILTGCQTEWCVNATTRAAAALGCVVRSSPTATTTVDTDAVKASEIIVRHNREEWPKLAHVIPAAAVIASMTAPSVARTSIEKILMERFAIDEAYYAETVPKYIGEDGRTDDAAGEEQEPNGLPSLSRIALRTREDVHRARGERDSETNRRGLRDASAAPSSTAA